MGASIYFNEKVDFNKIITEIENGSTFSTYFNLDPNGYPQSGYVIGYDSEDGILKQLSWTGSLKEFCYDCGDIDGITGPTGPQGIAGPTGPQGEKGEKGSQGPKGDQGKQGIQGIRGMIGPTGPQGMIGPTGSQGIIGPTGPQGMIGPTGPQGIIGPTGPTGPQGIQGIQGEKGDRGSAGFDGEDGEMGLPGIDGSLSRRWEVTSASASSYPDQGEVLFKDSNDIITWESQYIKKIMIHTLDSELVNVYNLLNYVYTYLNSNPNSVIIQITDVYNNSNYGAYLVNSISYIGGNTLFEFNVSSISTFSDFSDLVSISFVFIGNQGMIGPIGPQGMIGPTGPTGPQGIQGMIGPTGPQGMIGPTGPQGMIGPTGPQGISSNIIEKTYLELTTMISNSELDPGQLYLMSDFQTIYDQPDYSDATIPKPTVVTKTAAVDPIILLAISETEFAKEVWRPSTPKHTLEYDINFSQTEVMGAPAKGRITYCKDEFNNETHYDHTVVLLKRYESASGSGIFNSFWDTGFGSTEVLTFGAGSLSNKIGDNYYELAGGYAVSNNVLGAGAIGNSIGIVSNNNTFGDNTQINSFGNTTSGNTFGDGVLHNTFGDGAYSNNFGNNTLNNTFGNNTIDNIFGNNTQNNSFGGNTNGNTFGNNTQYNTFGNDMSGNTFGDYTQYNTFGNDMSDNTFGGYTRNNTFGNNTHNNTFGNNTQYNTFGDYTVYITFGNNTHNNTFGDGAYANTFGDSTQYNTFGDNIQSIDFTITQTPTHVYGNYPCNIFKRQDGTTVRLSYYDNTDTLVVVDPTD